MMKKFGTALVALALAGAPYGGGMYVAAAEVDPDPSIDVNAISVTQCGEQSMTFSGTAVFPQNLEHLQVILDGQVILHHENATSDISEAWSTPAIIVGAGTHVLTVTMFDQYLNEPQGVLAGPVVNEFTITDCDGGSSDDSNGGGDGPGDQGPGGDCCPGPDPNDVLVKKPMVKGASSATSADRLQPLNSIFRTVFDRDPTFEEWTYWANRLLGDKTQYEALLGAMQWHQLQGRSIGDPV